MIQMSQNESNPVKPILIVWQCHHSEKSNSPVNGFRMTFNELQAIHL